MPSKIKQCVRNESSEVVSLLLSAKKKKKKNNEDEDIATSSSQNDFSEANIIRDEINETENEIYSSEENDNAELLINNADIKRDLAIWSVKHTISNSAINELLIVGENYWSMNWRKNCAGKGRSKKKCTQPKYIEIN
uniref:Uncharacterized protein n=1 Tax=Bactrocera dorsalis TaxID=27457 RepID=A0A034WPU9_BACDO